MRKQIILLFCLVRGSVTKSTYNFFSDKQNVESDSKKIRVTMVAWDRSDLLVVTAVSDHSMKVWTANSGQLVKILTGMCKAVIKFRIHFFY